jgi:general secretion pathway protein F
MTDDTKTPSPDRDRLTAREAESLTEAIADVAASGRPLVDGLRATAREVAGGRVARQLQGIAAEIAAGRSLDDVLSSRRFPGPVAGLVRAAVRTGKVGDVLVELADHRRTVNDMWRSIVLALSYPTLLIVLAALVGVCVQLILIDPMIFLFEDFDLELPYMTQVLIWGSRQGVWWLLGFAGLFLAAAVLLRLIGGAARWRRVLSTVPLIGVLWYWTGVAELSRLLAILIEYGIALPEALRLAAEGVRDANMGQVGRDLAEGVEQGRSLSEMMATTHRLPATLAPLVRWGERSGQLDEAFRVASEMYVGRVQMRAELVAGFLPPLVFVFVATFALLILVGLYAPMISLIQWLT